jgi:hypothetical protein
MSGHQPQNTSLECASTSLPPPPTPLPVLKYFNICKVKKLPCLIVRHIVTLVTSFRATEYEYSHMLHLHTDANGYLKMLVKYCITWYSFYLRGMGKDCRRDLHDKLHNYTSPALLMNSGISRKQVSSPDESRREPIQVYQLFPPRCHF